MKPMPGLIREDPEAKVTVKDARAKAGLARTGINSPVAKTDKGMPLSKASQGGFVGNGWGTRGLYP